MGHIFIYNSISPILEAPSILNVTVPKIGKGFDDA